MQIVDGEYHGYDHGETFRSEVTVVEHSDKECRIYGLAFLRVLWITWAQARGFNDGRSGVWVAICDNPDAEKQVRCMETDGTF